MIEDSPYKFMSFELPKNIESMTKIKEGTEVYTSFKEVYRQFLNQLTHKVPQEEVEEERVILKQMASLPLYTELDEYLSESIELNNGKLSLINEETDIFEIYVESAKFQCGLSSDSKRNHKELIAPYKTESS